jgi:hypothetical protein
MKLTDKQKEALLLLKEEKSFSLDSSKVHKNTMNALYFKSLVKTSRYANGEFWEITDKGLDEVDIINNIIPHHEVVLDVFGGTKMQKFQNDFMHCGDVFEKGKHLAEHYQIVVTGNPNLEKLCENYKNAYEKASGGYILFVAIKSIDGKRTKEPKAYIKEGIQSISMVQNGELGWSLFKDLLTHLGYEVKTNQYMMVESVS